MWATQWQGAGWQVQQANFQCMPHDQVDWAALAKQWIAQKEAVGTIIQSAQHPPAPPPEAADNSGHGDSMDLCLEDNTAAHRPQNVTGGFGGPDGWGWGGGEGGSMSQPWTAPPQSWGMPQPTMVDSKVEPQGFDYNHSSFQQFDYNHGGEFNNYNNQIKPKHLPGEPPWVRGPQPSQFPQRTQTFHRHQREVSPPQEDDSVVLDAARRKALPAWIREGLEKMEREKQKKQEREQRLRENEAAQQAHAIAEREAEERKKRESYQDEPHVPQKSKFESDDEDNADKDGSASPAANTGQKLESPQNRDSPVVRRSPSPIKTEEEKQAELILKVRRMLTEVLLEVTDSELLTIAREVYQKAKAASYKAPATQLAKSTALARLTQIGLGYGSDSDDDVDGNDDSKHNDDETSESEDDEIIHKKRESFERLQRRRLEEQEREEQEQKTRRKQEIQNTPAFLKDPLSESHSKYPFQQSKSSDIPGLDAKHDSTDELKDSAEPKVMKERDRTVNVIREMSMNDGISKLEKKGENEREEAKKKPHFSSSSSSSDTGSSSTSSSDSDSSSSGSSSTSSSSSDKRSRITKNYAKSKTLIYNDDEGDGGHIRSQKKFQHPNPNRSNKGKLLLENDQKREHGIVNEWSDRDDKKEKVRHREKVPERHRSRSVNKMERNRLRDKSSSLERSDWHRRERDDNSRSRERNNRLKRAMEERSQSREKEEHSKVSERSRRQERASKDFSYDKYADSDDRRMSLKFSRREEESTSSKRNKRRRTPSESPERDSHGHSKQKRSSMGSSPSRSSSRRLSRHEERDEYYESSGKKSSHKHRSSRSR